MPRRRATYVLRLWTDSEKQISTAIYDADMYDADTRTAHDDQSELRGSLQPVDSEEARHFASLEQLIALLQNAINDLKRAGNS